MKSYLGKFNNTRMYLFENTIKVLKELYKKHSTSSFVSDTEHNAASEPHLDAMLDYIMELERDRVILQVISEYVEENKWSIKPSVYFDLTQISRQVMEQVPLNKDK